MKNRSLSHLSDASVSDGFHSRVTRDHTNTADLLEFLGEYDVRKLWAPLGYPSMLAYCVEGLHMSDDVALVRIRAARACRDFPTLFDAVAEGRLHLSAVLLLNPHLKPENVEGLVAAATHRTKTQIERLLAERFPRPDMPTLVHKVSLCSQVLTGNQLAPERVEAGRPFASERVEAGRPFVPERVEGGHELASERVESGLTLPPDSAEAREEFLPQRAELPPVTARVSSFQPRAKVTALAPERFALQVTISQATHDKLRRAQDLLSHALPSGNVADVLDRAFDALIRELEKRKFAATSKPRAKACTSNNPRHIPAQVKRAVMARDQGRCTFVSDCGRRCSSRKFLEFDHVLEVARGGTATISGVRLRCRAHNQYAAEWAFGPALMDAKRRAAAEARKATGTAATGTRTTVQAHGPACDSGAILPPALAAGAIEGAQPTKAAEAIEAANAAQPIEATDAAEAIEATEPAKRIDAPDPVPPAEPRGSSPSLLALWLSAGSHRGAARSAPRHGADEARARSREAVRARGYVAPCVAPRVALDSEPAPAPRSSTIPAYRARC